MNKNNFYIWHIEADELQAKRHIMCFDNGVIRVADRGFTDLLKDYNSKEELIKCYQENYEKSSAASSVANAYWLFSEMEEGDVVVAIRVVKGVMWALAYGAVKGSYKYDDSVEEYKHSFPMEWHKLEVSKELNVAKPKSIFRKLDDKEISVVKLKLLL